MNNYIFIKIVKINKYNIIISNKTYA